MRNTPAVDGPAFDVAAVRSQWVDRVVSRSAGRYPVEYDPIRRYCHMVGDTNPLFLDRAAAAAGPYGEVICPGPLIPYFAGNGPWPRRRAHTDPGPRFTLGVPTPGDRGINMTTSWDYLVPVRVGDQLTAQVRIADVFVKAIRLDPEAVWIVSETDVENQHAALVARGRNTVLVHRAPADAASDER